MVKNHRRAWADSLNLSVVPQKRGLKTITTPLQLVQTVGLRLWGAGIPFSSRPLPADEIEATVLENAPEEL